MTGSQRWRGVVSALADRARRSLYARIIVAADAGEPLRTEQLEPQQRRRLRVLTASGVVVETDGVLTAGDPFEALLAQGGPAVPTGPARFLTGGKLRGLPRRASDRAEVLAWLAARAMEPGESLDERQVTARLAALADDPVALRRHLIDAGLLTRSPDGSGYRLVADAIPGQRSKPNACR